MRVPQNREEIEKAGIEETAPGVSRAIKTVVGKYFWAIGYGATNTGNVPQALVNEYLEYHRNPSNQEMRPMILEGWTFSPE